MGPLERRIVEHRDARPTKELMRAAARVLDQIPASVKAEASALGEKIEVRFDSEWRPVAYRGNRRLDGIDPLARWKARLKVKKAALSAKR